MKYYKISENELDEFAKKIYETGSFGYLDLKDSTCESLLAEFLQGKQEMPVYENVVVDDRENLLIYTETQSGDMNNVIINVDNSNFTSDYMMVNNAPFTIKYSEDIMHQELRSQHSFNDQPQDIYFVVATEDHNFHGNESERL